MTPHKIKALLVEHGIPQTKIARALKISGATVSIIIARRGRSRRVEKYIAEQLGIPYKKLWGSEPRRKAS